MSDAMATPPSNGFWGARNAVKPIKEATTTPARRAFGRPSTAAIRGRSAASRMAMPTDMAVSSRVAFGPRASMK